MADIQPDNFKIVETFTNGTKFSTFVKTIDEATALGICTAFGGTGSRQAFEASSSITVEEASLTPVSYKRANIMLKNEGTDDTTFLNLVVKSTVSDLDIVAVLKNKTINDVKADKVVIISIIKTTV